MAAPWAVSLLLLLPVTLCHNRLEVVLGTLCTNARQVIRMEQLATELSGRGHKITWIMPDTSCDVGDILTGRVKQAGGRPEYDVTSDWRKYYLETLPNVVTMQAAMVPRAREVISQLTARNTGVALPYQTIAIVDPLATGICMAAELEGVLCVQDSGSFLVPQSNGLDEWWNHIQPLLELNDNKLFERGWSIVHSLAKPVLLARTNNLYNTVRTKFELPPVPSIYECDATVIRSAAPLTPENVPANKFIVGLDITQQDTTFSGPEADLLIEWLVVGPPTILVHLESTQWSLEDANAFLKVLHDLSYLSYKMLWVYKDAKHLSGQPPRNVNIIEALPNPRENGNMLSHPGIAAVVCNGEYYTIVDAIVGGTPMVIHPVTLEQTENARLVSSTGLGHHQSAPLDDVTVLKGYLVELTDEHKQWFDSNLKKAKQQMAAHGGSSKVADHLERLGSLQREDVRVKRTIAVYEQYPQLVALGLDVILLVCVILPIMGLLLLCWCCGCCSSKSAKSPNTAKQATNQKATKKTETNNQKTNNKKDEGDDNQEEKAGKEKADEATVVKGNEKGDKAKKAGAMKKRAKKAD